MESIVTNLQPKFSYDRLRNEKVFRELKISDNNNLKFQEEEEEEKEQQQQQQQRR